MTAWIKNTLTNQTAILQLEQYFSESKYVENYIYIIEDNMTNTGIFSSDMDDIYHESDGEILELFQNSDSTDWELELEGIGEL